MKVLPGQETTNTCVIWELLRNAERPHSRLWNWSLHFTDIPVHTHSAAQKHCCRPTCAQAGQGDSPARRPGWPEHPQSGTKSQTLGRFTKDFGLSST